jgi:hypothetical protein
MLKRFPAFLLVAVIALSGEPNIHFQSSPPTVLATPLIREEQKIVVNGISELWRLEWKSPPKSVCGPADLSSSITCPCSGFAFGESGPLDLVRLTNDREIDRLELSPLFEKLFADQDGALIQRWMTQEKDFEFLEKESAAFVKQVQIRPAVKIMDFADYNHDGKSTEFFLQTSVEPCGKITGVVVGLDGTHPKLHPFGTAAHPDKPLVIQKREWEALLKATGPIEVLDWRCGDHGGEIESNMELSATNGSIRAIRREYECTEKGNRGRFLREEIF